MKKSIRQAIILLALTILFVPHSPLRATTILAGTSPAIVEMDTNGLLDDIGTYGTGTLSLSGAGTRMFWYPGKAAFRAGYVSGTNWNDTNIGAYSVAFGYDTKANGAYAVAMGYGSIASGSNSIAVGSYATASGSYSTALGEASATGSYASFASGCSVASGMTATSMGQGTTASGTYATAMGYGSTASGTNATATGNTTTATAYDSFAIGTYNVGGGTATSWVSTDPLFEIGNGTYGSLHDAFVVYKNGNATLQGVLNTHGGLNCPQQGDLSMGSFTAGTAP
jgi:hypothetical protein